MVRAVVANGVLVVKKGMPFVRCGQARVKRGLEALPLGTVWARQGLAGVLRPVTQNKRTFITTRVRVVGLLMLGLEEEISITRTPCVGRPTRPSIDIAAALEPVLIPTRNSTLPLGTAIARGRSSGFCCTTPRLALEIFLTGGVGVPLAPVRKAGGVVRVVTSALSVSPTPQSTLGFTRGLKVGVKGVARGCGKRLQAFVKAVFIVVKNSELLGDAMR